MNEAKRSEVDTPDGSVWCVRRIPINFQAVAKEAGVTRGRIVHSPIFGWGVQNNDMPCPLFACITPPPMMGDETEIRIEDNSWSFYAPTTKGQP